MKRIKITQHRPFQATIPQAYKQGLIDYAVQTGIHQGIFFDTSGKCRTERINPTAQYAYLFRTDEHVAPISGGIFEAVKAGLKS